MQNKTLYAIAAMRICLGFVFLWAFVDKIFGLGFNTVAGKAWLDGVSPTYGFLKFGVTGPLTGFYQGLAGNPLIDWLFMAGILGIGLSLLLGVFTRLGAISGIVFLALMYSAVLPLIHNPVVDEHVVEIIALFIILFSAENQKLGLKK